MIAEILSCLPIDECDEYHRLESRKRRSATQQRRMQELWDLASKLHRQERERRMSASPEDDLVLYAQDIGKRMRSRRSG
jgi:hypothetical protein